MLHDNFLKDKNSILSNKVVYDLSLEWLTAQTTVQRIIKQILQLYGSTIFIISSISLKVVLVFD